MGSIFKAWKTSRRLYLDFFDKYTVTQLNTIPQGFNNNLVWNIGHIIVAQQSLIYKLSDLPMCIPDNLVHLYKPGSKPEGVVTEEAINELKTLLVSLVEQTESDFHNGKFVVFTERTTGTGFHLASLTDAFEFNNYHEGLHLGYMMGLRKFV